MLWSPRLSLSNFHVKLTAKGLFRNLQLLPGCRKNTVVFHAVDKNKPREAPARPTNSSSQITTGNQQNQQLAPAESVPDVLNANTPVTPTLPVPSPDDSITTSGCAGPTGPGLKARTGSRSSPKHRSRLQHASRPGVGGAVAPVGTVTVKQNQNKEQMERKNQAIIQLRRLLVQGNRRVEALAVVIQHLFSEVFCFRLHSFLKEILILK
ncbi:hypothetical protein XENORESO_016821 [Xenotaenia resolanae]|uniref:Uncharacterized protein n=1 Tax=Xenotaenia resolanae TaxID=208358 RepID=A0ABV0VT60_9TELE